MSVKLVNGRRGFVKQLLLAGAVVPVLSMLGFSRALFAAPKVPAGVTPVSEGDPVASALGYVAEEKKIDFAKYPDRKLPANKSHFCQNCDLFTPIDKEKTWGKCTMIMSGAVYKKGWCGSWRKKEKKA